MCNLVLFEHDQCLFPPVVIGLSVNLSCQICMSSEVLNFQPATAIYVVKNSEGCELSMHDWFFIAQWIFPDSAGHMSVFTCMTNLNLLGNAYPFFFKNKRKELVHRPLNYICCTIASGFLVGQVQVCGSVVSEDENLLQAKHWSVRRVRFDFHPILSSIIECLMHWNALRNVMRKGCIKIAFHWFIPCLIIILCSKRSH